MKSKISLLLLIILCFSPSMLADDNESNHVEVLLTDSTRVRGYWRNDFKTGMKRLFSKTGSINQYITIRENSKDGESKTYKAPEVLEYRFLEKTEDFPEGATWASENINAPGMFRPNNCVRGFALVLYKNEVGSILKWNVFETTGGRNTVSRLVPAVGVKLKGAKAAYGIMTNGRFFPFYLMNYLKKSAPEFKDMLDDYFNKCEDHNAHRDELKDNPAIILSLYEEYLKTHAPIDDKSK